jgi:hypothetical protein
LALAEDYLARVCESLPVTGSVIRSFGHLQLSRYLEQLDAHSTASFQERHDLLQIVHRHAESLLGKPTADRVASQLACHPVVLTTNHHGVDFFSQAVQGSIFFALHKAGRHHAQGPAIVFSCGNIPLNASSYPRGLLVYHVGSAEQINDMPKRLPVFPNRLKRSLVTVVPPVSRDMLAKAGATATRMAKEGIISSRVLSALHTVLDQDYAAEAEGEPDGYSSQAVRINRRLFGRMFSGLHSAPEVVYLELEHIATELLLLDLAHSASLARLVLFHEPLRHEVIPGLDGERGCWHVMSLLEHLRNDAGGPCTKRCHGPGTVFFWGIDDRHKRVPLFLLEDKPGHSILLGRDDRGREWKTAYTPEAITQELVERRLTPSLFTCFLVLSLARGVTCVGGYFQGRYLAAMQRAVVDALRECNLETAARLVASVQTAKYLDSMLAIMTEASAGHLVPAGPVEIIAGGGIQPRDIEPFLSLTVREAHLAALFETVPDAIPPAERAPGWKQQLAAELYRLLGEAIVVK